MNGVGRSVSNLNFTAKFLCSNYTQILQKHNSVQQQFEHHHYKVLIEIFHLSGHTLAFIGQFGI